MKGFEMWLTTLLITMVPCAKTQSSAIICEDSIDGQTPYNSNALPCLLGCGAPIAQATGGLLPGSVNETDVPYCQLNCVRKDPTPSQSGAAPGCHSRCQFQYEGTPENYAWCMYWCVDGFGDLVASTTCIPSLEYYPVTTSVVDGEFTVTVSGFTQPSAWLSWYQTQTVLPQTTAFNPMSTGASDSIHSTQSTSPTPTETVPPLTNSPTPVASSAQLSQSTTPAGDQATTSTAVPEGQHQQSPRTSTNVALQQQSSSGGLVGIICIVFAIFL